MSNKNHNGRHADRRTDRWTDRRTDGQTDEQTDRWIERQTEKGDLFLRTLGIMKLQQNVKVESRPMDSITILPSLMLGK